MATESMPGNPPDRRATGHGRNPPGQGPFIDVTLLVTNGTIFEASYETFQCPGCHACGKAIVTLVKGKTIAQARELRHEDIVREVGPLPRYRQICYGLALLALNDALRQLGSAIGHESPA